MELKLVFDQESEVLYDLLILPYVIETTCTYRIAYAICLIIVPYGIETTCTSRIAYAMSLLIVPYGIETLFYTCNRTPFDYF